MTEGVIGRRLKSARDSRYTAGRGKEPFIPRKEFYRLAFPEDTTFGERNLWKNKHFHKLQNDVAIPNGNKYWFKNIYVRRTSPQVIDELKRGVYGNIKFISMDQPPLEKKSVRYKEYIVRGYPSAWKLDGLPEYFGNKSENVHKTFRMKYNGKDSDSVKVIWKSDTENPPTKISLFEGTSIENDDDPVMRIEEMEKRPVICYACHKTGHIARHCNDNDEENDRDGRFHARQESTWRRSAPDETPASIAMLITIVM